MTRQRLGLLIGVAALVVGAAGCDWYGFGWGSYHSGFNPGETAISTSNVSNLVLRFKATTGSSVDASPAVVNGVLYVGADDGKFYAFDANGKMSCTGTPEVCSPLWTATIGTNSTFVGSQQESSPAVSNGVVYVTSNTGTLYAFDATGKTNCSGSTVVCSPLWTASSVSSSPTVGNGVVYVSGGQGLEAFDAAGNTNCSGSPKVCSPLWTAPSAASYSHPSVANGVVYAGAANTNALLAFDAAGNTNCSGAPKVCTPLWQGPTTYPPTAAFPAVVNGVVYVHTGSVSTPPPTVHGQIVAFDAAGKTGCIYGTCYPLWTTTAGGFVSGAVGNGMLLDDGFNFQLGAFPSGGCGSSSCSLAWIAYLNGGLSFDLVSSPAVANGVVFVGSLDSKLYAFDAAGQINCSGSGPATCTPLWTATTGGAIYSSPAIANGMVYVGSSDGNLYAYGLPSS